MLGQVGQLLLALLWRMDRREARQRDLASTRSRLSELKALIVDAKEREEGLLFQFDQLLRECRNEARVEKTELAAVALPMNRLRSMRRKVA